MNVMDWGTLIGDIVESIMSLESSMYHFDLFNYGILFGKTSKLMMQMWMKGIIFS